MRFFINERKWMKIRWFSEEFRSLPTITEDFRKKPKTFRTYIIHISESRVQSPESRVQSSPESSPESSPGFRLWRSNETEAIWTPWDVKYYATASGYICHLDHGYRLKPCLITGLIELLPWLTFYCLGRHLPWYQLVFTHAKHLPRLVNSNTLVKRSSVNAALVG